MTTKTEFAVNMTCGNCVKAVEESLSSPNIQILDIDLKKNSVVVESSLSTSELLQKLETSGRKVVVKGLGSSAGVAVLETGEPQVKGVVRFVQLPSSCIVDGTIDGLEPGKYKLTINENGDISRGCESCGDVFYPKGPEVKRSDLKYGELGEIQSEPNGRSSFRFENKVVSLPDLIGRSLVISKLFADKEKRFSCGIIARSAGLFQNSKTICACSGMSIWDEEVAPIKSTL